MSLLPDGATAEIGGSVDPEELTALIRKYEAAFLDGESHRAVSETESTLTGPDFDLDECVVRIRNALGVLIGAALFHQRTPWVTSFTETFADPDRDVSTLRRALEAWTSELATARIDRAPDHAQVSMALGIHGNDGVSADLYRELGYHEERYFLEMVRTFDGPVDVHPMPAGLTLRTLGPDEDVDRIAETMADAFQDHFGFTEQPLEDRIERWRHARTQDHWDDDLAWFAQDGDEIAGINVCLSQHGLDATQGYVATLGVRQRWRGQGLARALLTESFAEYQRRGMKSVSLHVDADSLTGATRLYEGVGMTETNRYIDFERVLRPGEDLIVR